MTWFDCKVANQKKKKLKSSSASSAKIHEAQLSSTTLHNNSAVKKDHNELSRRVSCHKKVISFKLVF